MKRKVCVLITAYLLICSGGFTAKTSNEQNYQDKIVFENTSVENLSTEQDMANRNTNINLTVKLNYESSLNPLSIDEANMSIEEIQEYRKEYFKSAKNYFSNKNQNMVKNMDLEAYDDTYVSNYSPYISLSTDWENLSNNECTLLNNLAMNDEVEQIYVNKQQKYVETLAGAKWYTGVTDYIENTNPNLTGKNIIVGVLEVGVANPNHSSLTSVDIEVFDDPTITETITEHACMVSSIIAGPSGIAPDAKIKSAEISGDAVSEMDWLIEKNVNLINMSFGEEVPTGRYNSLSAYVDYIAFNYGITMVAAAGNEGYGTGYVGNPGLGYNVLTVGACTSDTKADLSFSSNVVRLGPRKPNIVAPGYALSIPSFGGGHSGTSYSSAFTSGAVALLMQSDKYSILRPHRVYGILQTSGDKTSPNYMGSGLNKYVGTGALNFKKMIEASYGTSYYAFSPTKTEFTIKNVVTAFVGQHIRVAFTWLANANGNVGQSHVVNYNLFLYDMNNKMVANQQTSQDCIEYIELTAPTSGTYYAKIIQHNTGRTYLDYVAISANAS